MPSHITAGDSGAIAIVQGFSRKTGKQRDDGHLATTPEDVVALVMAHHPDDRVSIHPADTDARNRIAEAQELDDLRAGPDRVFLYVSHPKGLDGFSTRVANVHTWLGTVVSSTCQLGPKSYVGFGYHSYRRSVDCRIFGVRYVGWYYESSGDYCRLRKAKRQ